MTSTKGQARTIATALLTSALLATAASAQDYWFGVSYDTSMPLEDTKEFAGDFSWLGLSLEGRKMVRDNASVGFVFAWHEMDKEFTGVDPVSPGLDVHSVQKRYINSFPMLVNGHYYFGQPGKPRLHVGLGLGAYLIERRTEVGALYVIDDDVWHFGIAPEAGIAWRVGWQAAGLISVRFNWASPGADAEEMYLNFRVGMAWM